MDFSLDDIRNLARMAGLEMPEEELNTVALRLSSTLSFMEEIEKAMGEEMDKIDPIPPVYPKEEF